MGIVQSLTVCIWVPLPYGTLQLGSPYAKFTIWGYPYTYGDPSMFVSAQTHNLPVLEMAFPFPVMAPISSSVLFWIPLLEIFHLVRSPNWQSAITGTGRDSFCTISGTGLCHSRYSHSLGPAPELDSMRVVSFPVPGSSSSATIIVKVPYQN